MFLEKIGIIGALDAEIDILLNSMENKREIKIGKTVFYEGRLSEKDVVVFKCGVGKVNAAIGANTAILKFDVSKIIFTGIAGAIDNKLNILDLVISTDLVQHDFDLTGFGYPLGLIDGEKSIKFKADETLVTIANNSATKILGEDKVYLGTIATGDQFVANKRQVNFIGETFGAKATEMEGAAVAQVALNYDIPFVVLRAMSDKADGSAHMDYNEFKPVAADHSAKIVVDMLKHI
ncbi:5'-methylthioadenosine/adenosylhomocysteine nucleosidase [Fusobacterium sp. MFO224]|uniref:5'-methylthioadenosine/adenosylhomocysteine nucleosidase n=1 Tax=Fusobacterium sp. MFO224 TaxID=3378070 RepID=UPI0038532FBF